MHHLHQKAGELWASSPSNFCVPLSDRSVQDLLSLQNFPECTQLIDFPLIALLICHASAGSPCFPGSELYPRVRSEITLIGPLLSLTPLYLNSSHGQFMVYSYIGACSARLCAAERVPGLLSVLVGLMQDRARCGGIALRKDPPAPAPLRTEVRCPKGSAASLLAESLLQNKRRDLGFRHLRGLYLDAASHLHFSAFWREGQKGGPKPSRYLKHLVSEGGQKEMGWVSPGRLG